MVTAGAGAELPRKETSMKGPRTRSAILEAAAVCFSTSGYEITTLEHIADRLSISRGTVLFHFASKRALLMEIVQPLFRGFEAVIADFEGHPTPLAARQRRQLLTRYCELLLEYRYATILMVRDLTTIIQMHWPDGGPELTYRFHELLQGKSPSRDLKLRTAATIGSILRPIVMPPIDPCELDEDARSVIVNSALAAYSAHTPSLRTVT